MSRKAKSQGPEQERSRKLGSRRENITVALDDEQVRSQGAMVCDLLGRKENLLAASKSVAADYKAKLKRVDEQISVALRAQASRKLDTEIEIEEWLMRDNQVVQIRADTGERLGARTATAEELQELLFNDAADDTDGFPTGDEAFGAPS